MNTDEHLLDRDPRSPALSLIDDAAHTRARMTRDTYRYCSRDTQVRATSQLFFERMVAAHGGKYKRDGSVIWKAHDALDV